MRTLHIHKKGFVNPSRVIPDGDETNDLRHLADSFNPKILKGHGICIVNIQHSGNFVICLILTTY